MRAPARLTAPAIGTSTPSSKASWRRWRRRGPPRSSSPSSCARSSTACSTQRSSRHVRVTPARLPFPAANWKPVTYARCLRLAGGPRGDRTAARQRRALGLPRQLSHRHRVPDQPGGRPGAAVVPSRARPARGAGSVRGAARLLDEPCQPSRASREWRGATFSSMPCPIRAQYIWGATAGPQKPIREIVVR